MTAPDPRVGEIEARLAAANAELDRLTSGNPGTNWRWSIPANPERDSDLILSASIADVSYLLDELRKAHEALARVEAVTAKLSDWAGRYKSAYYDEAQDDVVQIIKPVLRAAVAAANGDGQQVCRRKCDCVNSPEGSPDCRYCDYEESE